ncbi:MAG: hypothetical protein OIF57_11335 [Marinobacterium sp.]|nr:hypothetical protein [Marinobacterium sp.]
MFRAVSPLRIVSLAVGAAVFLSGCQQADTPQSWQEYARQGLYSAAISPQARYVSLGSSLHGGSLWDLRQNARLFNWNHQAGEYSTISATAFSPDEKYAVTASQRDLVLWETGSGKALEFLSSQAEILDLALAPEGNFALVGQADFNATYYDLKNGGITKNFRHDARVRAVALDAVGQLALTGSDAYKAKVWDLLSGELRHTLEFGNTVDTVALSADGRMAFSSATLDRAVIWDTTSGREITVLSGKKDELFTKRLSYVSARFSRDNRQLLTGSASGMVQLWDTHSGQLMRSWQLHKRDAYGPVSTTVEDVAFGTSRNEYLAVGANGFVNRLQ